ncbi:hypothetical protein [Moorena sp. SIO3A2]|uniref:hypothetical protein n=1 Tax=Moorena sp. SIO3A2 TaxID=2607841 RepID=UPI0013B5D194|nr:hypothetical protein [Moorena sp. SIO3A2]NER87077.1 hypothetical protein [Moorena sp. SIO3A2]
MDTLRGRHWVQVMGLTLAKRPPYVNGHGMRCSKGASHLFYYEDTDAIGKTEERRQSCDLIIMVLRY